MCLTKAGFPWCYKDHKQDDEFGISQRMRNHKRLQAKEIDKWISMNVWFYFGILNIDCVLKQNIFILLLGLVKIVIVIFKRAHLANNMNWNTKIKKNFIALRLQTLSTLNSYRLLLNRIHYLCVMKYLFNIYFSWNQEILREIYLVTICLEKKSW